MEFRFLPDTVAPALDAAAIARFLIHEDAEARFQHVRDARIVYVVQQMTLTVRGQEADACIARATVQGQHRMLFDCLTSLTFAGGAEVEFIIYFDAAAWARRRENPETGPSGYPVEQEALVYHELCHLVQAETREGEPRFHRDGRIMLNLKDHDYERFDDEIRRYGPVTLGIEQLGTTFVEGAQAEKARHRPKLRRVR